MHSGGQSEAKLQLCGSHLAVEELGESQFTKLYGKTITGLGPNR